MDPNHDSVGQGDSESIIFWGTYFFGTGMFFPELIVDKRGVNFVHNCCCILPE